MRAVPKIRMALVSALANGTRYVQCGGGPQRRQLVRGGCRRRGTSGRQAHKGRVDQRQERTCDPKTQAGQSKLEVLMEGGLWRRCRAPDGTRFSSTPQNAFNVFQLFEPVIVSWVLCCMGTLYWFVDVLTIVTLMDARRRFGGSRERRRRPWSWLERVLSLCSLNPRCLGGDCRRGKGRCKGGGWTGKGRRRSDD